MKKINITISKNHILSLILIVVFALIYACLTFENWSKLFQQKTLKSETSAKTQNSSCEEDWVEFSNNVIGIGFCYPKEWGTPITLPVESITKLQGIVDDYSTDKHNTYSNSIYLEFKDIKADEHNIGNSLVFHFFNDKYGGAYYPNSSAYEHGFVDNIESLKASENVCDYKTNFFKPSLHLGSLVEIWHECGDNMKNEIIDHQQFYNDANRHSYELRSLSFFKLQNGYFDNLMVKRVYGFNHSQEIISHIDDFFTIGNDPGNPNNTKTISQTDYEKFKREHQTFIRSIYVFKPETRQIEPFETIPEEDQNITIIRNYYWLLSTNQLKTAYEIYKDPNDSQEDFNLMYSNVYTAKPRDFENIGHNTYKFFVDYQDHNEKPTLYRIISKIENNKITNISAEEIVTDIAESHGRKAYSKLQHGKSYVILEENGKEIIVDQGVAEYNEEHSNIGAVKNFSGISFSPDGNYLKYYMTGWEWSQGYIYDITERKNKLSHDGPNVLEFTPDGKYIYVCSSSGISSGPDGFVYGVPEFEKKFDLLLSVTEDITDVDCEYDPNQKEVIFKYSGYCSNNDCGPEVTVKYSTIGE